MPIATIITAGLAILDYLEVQAQNNGGDLPDELVQQRTNLRRELARLSDQEASPEAREGD